MRQAEAAAELARRAEKFQADKRLLVDYYRVRRRVSFPLSLRELPVVDMGISFEGYPWHIWFAWELEERVNSLGWHADICGEERLRNSVRAEVLGIARWPAHSAPGDPSLPVAHLLRMLINARRHWRWLGEEVDDEIVKACGRAVEQKTAWREAVIAKVQSAEAVRAMGPEQSAYFVRNIPVIAASVLAMAAETCGHPAADMLGRYVRAVLEVRWDLLMQGTTEAIAYDGYTLDFACDWLEGQSPALQRALAGHPAVEKMLTMGINLAAPGDVLNVAQLGDVEPREMSFHASGRVKVGRLLEVSGESAWYLGRARVDWLKAEALGLMHGLPEELGTPPAAGAREWVYAASARSGFAEEDVAVVMGAGRSAMHHVHHDAGSILIGKGGQWLLTDPGYQQYLRTREREFTLGAHAHNAPVINGLAQNQHGAQFLGAQDVGQGVLRLAIDITGCYPPEAKVRRARRWVWLVKDNTVIVRDMLEGDIQRAGYTWHGLADAGWWAEDGKAAICHEGMELWISSPSVAITQQHIRRLPGSRGQQSLVAEVTGSNEHLICWWVFESV